MHITENPEAAGPSDTADPNTGDIDWRGRRVVQLLSATRQPIFFIFYFIVPFPVATPAATRTYRTGRRLPAEVVS